MIRLVRYHSSMTGCPSTAWCIRTVATEGRVDAIICFGDDGTVDVLAGVNEATLPEIEFIDQQPGPDEGPMLLLRGSQ